MGKKEDWYLKEVDYILNSFNSTKKGLSEKEVEVRLEKFGLNLVKEGKKVSFIEIFLRQFKNAVIYVLIFAAALSIFTGHKIEFIVILMIIGFVIILGFFEEFKASKDMEALLKLSPKKAHVIRGGTNKEVNTSNICVGDILVLKRGDIIAADARLIEGSQLKVDESILTGESMAVDKNCENITKLAPLARRANMLYADTHIVSGNGLAIVVETSKNTEIGKISTMLQEIKEEETPLQKRLSKLSKQISIGVVIFAALVFMFGLWRGYEWSYMLIFSMSILVSGIPESLPSVVAITLANGMKNMANRNAIVKRLPAVETLGTCSVICTDKTGTLTQNKMVIEKIFTNDVEVSVTGIGYNPKGIFLKEDIKIDAKKHKTLSKIIEIGVMCNNSDIKSKSGVWIVDGEATEGALVVLARKAGIVKIEYHQKNPRVKEHAFDNIRKCMSVIHKVKKKHIVYSKGAPEMLIEKAKYYFERGKIRKLDKKTKEIFIKKAEEYASKGLRVLGLAFKEHRGSLDIKSVESSLVFVGLTAIRDPPDPSVKGSIKKCKEAGIMVVMITGDNENTAKAIGREVGIYSENDKIINGPELDKMNEKQLEEIVEYVTIYARATPEHKLKIVSALQNKGHVVAMTGDGVNDAPALKKSDIGIAMGKTGTEVAKESAEMVLKDDNFTTIVNAVEEGRTIYCNIRKSIFYLLAGNFSEVLIILVAVFVGISLPLTALMVLFINLVTSDIPAIGIGLERPSERIMKEKPRNPKEGVLSDYILLKTVNVVPLIILGTLLLYMWELVIVKAPIEKARTVAFAAIIMFELFHAYNAKSWDETIFTKKFFSNKFFHVGIIASLLLTLLVIYLPSLHSIFGTVALGLKEWVPIILVSFTIILFLEIQKSIINSEIRERKKFEM